MGYDGARTVHIPFEAYKTYGKIHYAHVLWPLGNLFQIAHMYHYKTEKLMIFTLVHPK